MLPIMLLEASTYTPIEYSSWESVIGALTQQISVTTVVGVLASIATACVGLCFMWWGVRRSVKALMSSFKKGRLRL